MRLWPGLGEGREKGGKTEAYDPLLCFRQGWSVGDNSRVTVGERRAGKGQQTVNSGTTDE